MGSDVDSWPEAGFAMETRKARLKVKQGRKWVHQDIEVPTEDSVLELANRLHAARLPHRETIGEWQVKFDPPRPFDLKSQTYDLFGAKPKPTEWETQHIEGSSMFEIRLGNWIQPLWRISASWHGGEDNPPYISHDFKNLVFSPGPTQENLFVEEPSEIPALPAKPIFEGSAYQIEATKFERNPEARRLCIERHGSTCRTCGFDFAKSHGDVADGYIHIHHLTPISEIAEKYQIDPIVDLVPLCPNCHAVAHLRTPPYGVEEIRAFLRAAQDRS